MFKYCIRGYIDTLHSPNRTQLYLHSEDDDSSYHLMFYHDEPYFYKFLKFQRVDLYITLTENIEKEDMNVIIDEFNEESHYEDDCYEFLEGKFIIDNIIPV